MRILVEALTVSNFSGRHVFNGMLEQVVAQTSADYHFSVLYNDANKDIVRDYGSRVQWILCPEVTTHWLKRYLWMRLNLNKLIKRYRSDWLYTPSGGTYPWVRIPQASYVANPWALAYPGRKNMAERIKACMQRASYARAVRDAKLMIYITDYMRQLFRENAGCKDQDSVLFYSGLKPITFERSANFDKFQERVPGRILTVSVMTPHKNLETIARAMPEILKQCPQAHWRVVGTFSDEDYRARFCELIDTLGIASAVELVGFVDDDALENEYAQACVYCLMSKCESFGIPAVEAQAYGTPAVGGRCCAIPEVCGDGSLYCDPDDVDGVSAALLQLLKDDAVWQAYSQRAKRNAERFHWHVCAQELVQKMNACITHGSPH